jgi:hypothetical protein
MGKKSKKPPPARPFAAVAQVVPIEPISLEEADARYRLNAILDAVQCEVTAAYIHRGGVRLPRWDLTGATDDGGCAAYIIDGDLDIDELLAIDARSMAPWGVLAVTGALRTRRLGVVNDGKLWVGGDVAVEDLALLHHGNFAGRARFGTLLFHLSFPVFAMLPSIDTLLGRDPDRLESWQTRWHADLPAPALQADAFVPEHARTDMGALLEELLAGRSLRRGG